MRPKIKTEIGQAYAEYAVLLALIALVVLLALAALGVSVDNAFAAIAGMFRGSPTPTSDNSYKTEFDGDLKDWFIAKFGVWRGKAEIEHGKLKLDPVTLSMLKGHMLKDFDVQVSGVGIEHEKKVWNGYGLMFRADSSGRNGYMFEIEKKNAGQPSQMYFSKWVDGKQTKLPGAAVNLPDNFDWKNASSMQISARGDTLTAYVGGKQVLQTRDSTYSQGQVGIASNAGTEITVDSFSLTPK
jgi:Flp pilus assembly pilin Flp